MHGLINQAIERFGRATYGDRFWERVCRGQGLPVRRFEAMQSYDPGVTEAMLDGLAQALGKARGEVLEDIGTFLVSSPSTEALRRLLRFGGTEFVDFLYSLDDLPARVRLAVPELELPQMELREHGPRSFSFVVRTEGAKPWFGHVMVGLLRAMADDYGALVVLEHMGASPGREIIAIMLLETAFAEGRAFDLGAPVP
ncbi:heme NO-binding domain-containing protein [Roseovarius sp.]|uniref:heme NO-binding domain-containing protein n=1 Tax=Roseovarius sp. TaxID=1486281 RepID=UPI003BAC82AA